MNKYIKNYASKYRSLAEKLQTKTVALKDRILNTSPRAYITTCLLALSMASGYSLTTYALNKYEEIRQKNNLEQKLSLLTPEDKEMFLMLPKSYALMDQNVINQQGQAVEAQGFLTLSTEGKQAKEYAKNLAEALHAKHSKSKFETLDSKIDLAKEAIDEARTQIQWKAYGGLGNYSRNYEYSEERDKMREGLRQEILKSVRSKEQKEQLLKSLETMEIVIENADSRQTFDEFYGPKNHKLMSGDCEDFSTALTTAYHAIKDYAEANIGDSEFYRALAEGLGHYRIFSVGVENHAINMSVTHKDKPYLEMIEPQSKNTKFDIELDKNGVFPRELDESGNPKETNKVLNIFNRDLSIKLK